MTILGTFIDNFGHICDENCQSCYRPPMPHTAAQRARGPARQRHKVEPTKPKSAPPDRRAMASVAGKLGALSRGARVVFEPDTIPESMLPAVKDAMLLKASPVQHDRIQADQWDAISYAAKASRGLVRRLLRYAHDNRRKDAVRAAQVVLAVAGLMDGQRAKDPDPADPRDMTADGIRRMVFSAQARLSALESVAERLSDAPSGPQDAQPADLEAEAQRGAQAEAPDNPEVPAADRPEPELATVQPASPPAPFE